MRVQRINPNYILMLFTIAALLTVLWLLGLVSSYTLGGFIHILLVIAVIVILVRVIRGENPLL